MRGGQQFEAIYEENQNEISELKRKVKEMSNEIEEANGYIAQIEDELKSKSKVTEEMRYKQEATVAGFNELLKQEQEANEAAMNELKIHASQVASSSDYPSSR